jgi:hypothetical protein
MNAKRSRRSAQKSKPDRSGLACPSCGAETVAGAAYCHACGASLTGGAARGGLSQRALIGLAVIALVVAGGVFFLSTSTPKKQVRIPGPGPMTPALPQVAPTPGGVATGATGTPPDLSTMTPREAADRLFNRIMRDSEQGRLEQAKGFVPMAVQAYGNLQSLDRDAHYHLGLIHGIAGDRAAGERHIAALKNGAPNHLLAIVLEHAIARKAGDGAAQEALVERFNEAFSSEMALQRPEYLAHRNEIERFRAENGGKDVR